MGDRINLAAQKVIYVLILVGAPRTLIFCSQLSVTKRSNACMLIQYTRRLPCADPPDTPLPPSFK